MSNESYWDECIQSAFDDAGISATKEQVELVAGAVDVAHENFGMAHGHDVISANFTGELKSEIDRLKRELEAERNKSVCTECDGRGVTDWRSSRPCQRCFTCKGEGRI